MNDGFVTDRFLDRLERLAHLKEVRRTGWVLRGVKTPESVADHSWGTACLCLLLAPEEVNRDRAVAIALAHDLAEVETGDIPRRMAPGAQPVSPEEKESRERLAMQRLTGFEAPGGEQPQSLGYEHARAPGGDSGNEQEHAGLAALRSLWEEYARDETPESRFVRDMNLVDMCLQAVIYQRGNRYDPARGRENFPDYDHLDEFFATSRDRFRTEQGRALYRALWLRYQSLRDEGDRVPDR